MRTRREFSFNQTTPNQTDVSFPMFAHSRCRVFIVIDGSSASTLCKDESISLLRLKMSGVVGCNLDSLVVALNPITIR